MPVVIVEDVECHAFKLQKLTKSHPYHLKLLVFGGNLLLFYLYSTQDRPALPRLAMVGITPRPARSIFARARFLNIQTSFD